MARIARELPQLPPVSTRQLPPVAASHQLAGIIGAKLAVVKVAGMAFAVLGLAALVAGLLPHRSHHAHVRRAEAIRIAAAPVTRHTVQSRNTTARPVHSPHFPSSVAGQAVTHRTYMRLARTHSSMVKSSYSSPVQRDVMPLPVATRMAASTSTPPQAADTSATGQLLLMSLIMNVAPSAIKELGITSLGDKKSSVAWPDVPPAGESYRIGHLASDAATLTKTLATLEKRKQATILCRRTQVVKNGENVTSHIGDRIYYRCLSGYKDGQPIYSYQYIDTGVTLQVCPRVEKDGSFTLAIGTNIVDVPVFQQGEGKLPANPETSSTSVLKIQAGEVVALGGMRLPVKQVEKDNRELLILILPSVLQHDFPSRTVEDLHSS